MNGIFIQSIYIEELRHLKNVQIDIDKNEKKHLIITGKNGSGKSTLLEAIKSYLKSIEDNSYSSRINSFEEVKKYEKLINEVKSNQELTESEKQYKIRQLESTFNNYKYYIDRYGNWIELEIMNGDKAQFQYNDGNLIFSYFGAKRNSNVITPNGVEKIELSERYSIDNKPSLNFLRYLVDLKTQQSFARNEGDNKEADKIGLWFDSFENSLRNLMNQPELKLKFDYKNYNFDIIESNKEPYGFNELSDGYSAVLDIVMDLIMRMEKKASRAYDLEGIVLIDEVETHLHISLQKNIMTFLTSLFPNVQFIVTTHSPFVLNSIENAIIYDLEKKIKVEDLTMYSYEGIVEGYFNIDKYSQGIKSKVDRYAYLVGKNEKTDDEDVEMYELRKDLKNIPKDLAPELYGRFLEIEIQRRTMI
ncbi:AAA family ATPase [Paraclostridium bifermentans]|uniref:AAA family ATPase n=1 Tax=Paraclostridium bifermentans TaxID=1490 RepID=UPI001F2E23E9|nr:AAA family ATPase [Paraclostridium bifermentans]MCE9674421.1 AAA family ATPase [Paraclostridium bifermentans]